MAVKIMLDAGHGGYDNGASLGSRTEKNDALRLTLAVGQILQEDGYDVEYTRTTDVYDSPFEKAQMANRSGADYFVSIHRNASPNPNTYSGVETLVYNDSGIKAQMARNINAELGKLGFADLGVEERPRLVVLRRTKMPAILIEAGFINTDADNKRFDDRFEDIAEAIARGIEKTIGGNSGKKTVYRVQTGLFKDPGNAQYLLQRLLEDGFRARVVYKNPYYAVLVGNEGTVGQAVEIQERLRRDGYDTLVVKETT